MFGVFRVGPKNSQNFGWGKKSRFGPPLRPKKCFGPKLTKKSGGVKPECLQEGGPKMAKIEYGVKLDIFKITVRGQLFRPSPHNSRRIGQHRRNLEASHPSGISPAKFQICVLPWWTLIPASLHIALANILWIAPTLSGGLTVQMSSKNINTSPSLRWDWTCTRALCWPKQKSRGIIVSPCSPPSAME